MALDLTKLIDLDLLAYFKSKLDLLFANKVDKETGKGLSSNDYTAEEKTKLAGVASGAQVNVLEGIQKNGDTVTVTNKIANISVPTKTSDITNDSGFITASDVPAGPSPSTTSPAMDGTAAVGTETAYARGDHVHPKDTTKADKESPTFTGTPRAPTASAGTNTTQIATTAFVKNVLEDRTYDSSPTMNGDNAAAGTSTKLARGDHVHPHDIKKANLASPTFTGTPRAPTASAGTNTTQIATTAFVTTAVSGKADSSDVYTKTEIDSMLVGAMNYKGTKATVAALPSTGNVTGDVWHVTADGGEYAWNGSAWEELGTAIDLSGYVEESDISLATNADIDGLFE